MATGTGPLEGTIMGLLHLSMVNTGVAIGISTLLVALIQCDR